MDKQKNNTLELLKLFAAYMVVFIHVIFSGPIGVAVETLARFAVPFFFLISGYYSYRITPQKIKNRIKRILILILFATISYTVFNVIFLLANGDLYDVYAYFMQYMDFSKLVKLIALNVPICLEYLWYLYAILYVYAIFYFATILHINEKVIFIISISLLILQILLGEVLSIFGIVLSGLIVRNFAIMGISFFALGLLAKKYQHKLFMVSNSMIMLAIIVGVVESILSRYFLGKKYYILVRCLFSLHLYVCLLSIQRLNILNF